MRKSLPEIFLPLLPFFLRLVRYITRSVLSTSHLAT